MNNKKIFFSIVLFSLTSIEASQKINPYAKQLDEEREELALAMQQYLPGPEQGFTRTETQDGIESCITIDKFSAGVGQITHSKIDKLEYYSGQDFVNTYILEKNIIYAGLFDGHGEFESMHHGKGKEIKDIYDKHGLLNSGGIVAKFSSRRYPEIVSQLLEKYGMGHFTNHKIYKHAAENLQRELYEHEDLKYAGEKGGTTATMIFINAENGDAVTVNLGDSRTLILDQNFNVVFSTEDHKADSESEIARMKTDEASRDYYAQEEDKAGEKIHLKELIETKRLGNSLAVSRGFGDFDFKKYGHTYLPKIHTHHLTPGSFAVLISDGITDVMSNEEIALKIKELTGIDDSIETPVYLSGDELQAIANKLCRQAEELGSEDDKTVEIIQFMPEGF